MYQYVLATILFVVVVPALANEPGAFFCESPKGISYSGYQDAYIISGHQFLPKKISRKKNILIADSVCQSWARALRVKNYHLNYYDESSHGNNYHMISVDELYQKKAELLTKRHNQVKWFEVLNQMDRREYIQGTRLFVNNHSQQLPIVDPYSNNEQAQWIFRGGKYYCGFVGGRLAFKEKKRRGLSIIDLANNETFDYIGGYEFYGDIPGHFGYAYQASLNIFSASEVIIKNQEYLYFYNRQHPAMSHGILINYDELNDVCY